MRRADALEAGVTPVVVGLIHKIGPTNIHHHVFLFHLVSRSVGFVVLVVQCRNVDLVVLVVRSVVEGGGARRHLRQKV